VCSVAGNGISTRPVRAKKKPVKAKKQRPNARRISAENSAKKRKRGKPFPKGNPWRFQPGQSGNPGGRPKALRDAYTEWLKLANKSGVTNAMFIASSLGSRAVIGDTNAAREIRMATEGTTINTWQGEIVGLLKDGKVTPQEVVEELGDDATELLVAAGISADAGGSSEGAGETTAKVTTAEPDRVDAPKPPDAGAGSGA
jgi:hypothetical protein